MVLISVCGGQDYGVLTVTYSFMLYGSFVVCSMAKLHWSVCNWEKMAVHRSAKPFERICFIVNTPWYVYKVGSPLLVYCYNKRNKLALQLWMCVWCVRACVRVCVCVCMDVCAYV